MNAVARLLRNPSKYFRRAFWLSIKRVIILQIRPRIFFSPAQWQRLWRGEKPLRMYVFPAAMDKYQFQELYVAWKVLRYCNVDITASADDADIAIAWEPLTEYRLDRTLVALLQVRMHVLNAQCTDIRKSRVDAIFAEVFGYSLAVDPRTHHGTVLRKSEKNGAHDAVLLEAPLEPEPDHVYQRLVTSVLPKGIPDYRTFIVGGEVVAVNRNYRPVDNRFRPLPTKADRMPVEEAFSPGELALIRAFNDRMGLEFGVVDILRDADGRMYICDCNNTPTGPSRRLSIPVQLDVIKTVGDAFEKAYLQKLRSTRSSTVDVLPTPAEETQLRR